MNSAGRYRVLGAAALLLPLAALVAVVLAVAWPRSPAARVNADFPHPGIDFSIGVGTACDSTAGPTKCSLSPGQTFTVNMKLNSIPAGFTYDSYDAIVAFSGVNLVETSLVQLGSGVWPDCGFAASFVDVGVLQTGCAEGSGASPSAYTGVLWHVDFQCPDTATAANISLVNGPDTTDVFDDTVTPHGEDIGVESLTINCGNPPTPTLTSTPTAGTPGLATPTNTPSQAGTPTPTPGGGATPTPTSGGGATPTPTATPTRTPTITPTPTFTVTPTPTRRPHHTLLGDVDGDLSVDARDALWVLWFDAQIVVDVPIPEAADVNGDGIVNATDALLVLQFDAGVIDLL